MAALPVRRPAGGDEPFLLAMLFYAAHAEEERGARPDQLLAHLRLGFAPVTEVANRVGGVSEAMVLRFTELPA
jgi:hypothetical protein